MQQAPGISDLLASLEGRLCSRIDEAKAMLEGRCDALGSQIRPASASEQLERRMQAVEQHLEVLQAQTDALQSQLQREASKTAGLAEALRQNVAECADLRVAQQTSTESMQAGLQLLIGKMEQGDSNDGLPNNGTVGDLDTTSGTTIAGNDCVEALENLRAKLAVVAGDLAADLGAHANAWSSADSTTTTLPTLSPRSQALSSGPLSSPPHKLPRAPGGAAMRLGSTSAVPTLLGRAQSVPSIDPLANEPPAKALAAALARERCASAACESQAPPRLPIGSGDSGRGQASITMSPPLRAGGVSPKRIVSTPAAARAPLSPQASLPRAGALCGGCKLLAAWIACICAKGHRSVISF